MTIRKSVLVLAIFAGSLLLTACPSQTNVGKINADPGRYRNKEVGIVGRVSDSYGILGNGAYEIDDGTGKIWVISTGYGTPSKGAHVDVAGTLIQGANFGGRSFGLALRETRRRH